MQHKLITIRRLSAMYEGDLGFSIEDKDGQEIAAFIVKDHKAKKDGWEIDWCWTDKVFTERQMNYVLRPIAYAMVETAATVATLKLEG